MPAAARRAARVRMRRTQILAAARACFRSEGFHGASMSRIAETAGMSVGHIYQYYAGKEDIIIAICRHDFAEFMARMPGPDLPGKDNGRTVSLDNICWLLDPDRSAIALEVMSEASRNPVIAKVVREANAMVRARILRQARQRSKNLPEEEIAARVDAFLLMLGGLGNYAATAERPDPVRVQQVIAAAVRVLAPADT